MLTSTVPLLFGVGVTTSVAPVPGFGCDQPPNGSDHLPDGSEQPPNGSDQPTFAPISPLSAAIIAQEGAISRILLIFTQKRGLSGRRRALSARNGAGLLIVNRQNTLIEPSSG